MSLIIGDNFSYNGQKPLDARLVTQSLTTLLAVPSYTIYDGIQVYVESEKKYYVYDSNNDQDAILDRWREFTSGGSNGISVILKYSKVFTEEVNNDETISYADISGVTAITDIKVNQLLNDIAGIIAKVVFVDEANNEIQIRVLSKDTILKQDTVQYNGVLNAELDKIQKIDFAKINTTEAIADFSVNNLIYDENGVLAKVLSKDETNNELSIVPITLSVAIGSHDVYLTNEVINPKISSQTTLNFTDFVTSKLITDIEELQLVYDINGTLSKIDSIDVTNGLIVVTTISVSEDKSVKTYKYLGTGLSKVPDFKSSLNYSDLDTNQLLNTIKVNELIYDEDGTLAKIIMVDVPNSQLLVQTLTASGMPYAPVLKELVIKDGGYNYVKGNVFESSNAPGIFGEVTDVDTSGTILSVSSTTKTTVNVNGSGAVIDYDTVIYGAFGKNWAPLSNTSSSVAQIVEESFTYESGFNYEITNGGSNYKVGDVVNISGNSIEVTKVNAGVVEEVVWSREVSASTLGTGLAVTVTSSNDSFIIPADIWNNSNRNSFDLTNNDGANVEFNRLDGVNQKCAAGDGSIYKFTFDSKNGVIYQEKTEIDNGSGIGPFVSFKNYKKDELVINDNVIYICRDDHMAGATLGDDISHWTEMRKTITSGNRNVSYRYNFSAITSTNNWTKPTIDYLDGDQSLIVNNKLKVPVDGLYYMNCYPAYIFRDSTGTNMNTPQNERMFCTYKIMTNINDSSSGNTNVVMFWHSNSKEGRSEGHESSIFIKHFKAGEELELQGLWATGYDISGTVGQRCEFGLLAEDRSDNLVAEATMIMPSSLAKGAYTTITYEDTSNIGVISTNGDIILPDDGSYLVSLENLMSSTGGTSGSLETILRRKELDDGASIALSSYATCSKLQAGSLTHVINGLKGDTFVFRTYRSTAQSSLTRKGTPKVRLFKIKSVDYHIDSHDLYKDSGSNQTYEEWVKSQMKENQLSVTAQVIVNQTLSVGINNLIKYSYVSGENQMLQEDTKFVAPVSGLYSLDYNPISLTSSLSISLVVVKNNAASTSWENVVDYANVTSNWTSSGNRMFWLNKGEYLCIKARPASNVSIKSEAGSQLLGGITFTLLNSGLAQVQQYTVDKPHLWPDNQEVDLGDGLYGYKSVGTITANASATYDVVIPILEDITIVNWNAWFKHNTQDKSWLTGSCDTYYNFIFKTDKLNYRTRTTQARKNAPYKLWMTYLKEGIN